MYVKKGTWIESSNLTVKMTQLYELIIPLDLVDIL